MRRLRVLRTQSGDTIVEVVLAMTIIALVLGSASALANRSSRAMQDTQERSSALRVAQTQLERLKKYTIDHKEDLESPTSTEKLFDTAGFCVTTNVAGTEYVLVSASEAACKVNELNQATTEQPQYTIKIVPETDQAGYSNDKGYRAQIIVTWETLQGNTGKVELWYRTYDKLRPTTVIKMPCPAGMVGVSPECTFAGLPVTLTPSSHKFPAWHLYASSGTRKTVTFQVSNNTSTSIILGAATITGDPKNSFVIQTGGDSCSNNTLPKDATCNVVVAFAPAGGAANNKHSNAGKREAVLTIPVQGSDALTASMEGMTYSNVLASGNVLLPGEQLRSYNASCYNDTESCGVYLSFVGKALRVRRTSVPTVNQLSIPSDLNVLLYDLAGSPPTTPVNASMQTAGNLVVYTRSASGATDYSWATNSRCEPILTPCRAQRAGAFVQFMSPAAEPNKAVLQFHNGPAGGGGLVDTPSLWSGPNN